MSGEAYRGPNRGPAGCGTDLLATLIAMAVLAVIIIALGMRWGWW